jgi:hypothetical protein
MPITDLLPFAWPPATCHARRRAGEVAADAKVGH